MDYSKFYHDWLQIDLAPGEDPNFYQILGLKNMDPDVQKIETGFRSMLNRLQNVNGMSNPEAYTAILSRGLEAHKILTDPNLKYAYDLQLSQITGESVWIGYERPTFFTRVRQMSLIFLSFILGLGVMVMMALSVERNPDGSIIFHEEAIIHKAPPFTSQLEYVVYRPSIAQDYQPDGYAVIVNNPSKETAPKVEVHTETFEPKVESLDGDSKTASISENSSTESEMEEFSQILSEEIVKPDREEAQKVNRRSPLYKMSAAINDSSAEEKEEGETEPAVSTNPPESSKEITKDDLPRTEMEFSTEIPAKTTVEEPISGASETQQAAISLTSVMGLLENVRLNMDLSRPGATDAYTLLQYQTITEILQKLQAAKGSPESEEFKKFAEYALNVVTDLGWGKHFSEAFQLCGTLKAFGKEHQMAEILDETIDRRYNAVYNYQLLYNNSQKVLASLKENPDDPKLNTQYAMWLWQETGDLKDSVPYLAKCQFAVIRRAAVFEQQLTSNEKFNTPQATLQVADYWWEVAERLKDERQVLLVKEHAKEFYLKVDPGLLSDEQKGRLGNI